MSHYHDPNQPWAVQGASWQPYGPPPTLPHSGLGIASLAVALLTGLLDLILIVVAAIMDSRPGGMDEDSPAAMAVGCSFVVLMFVNLVGLVLGIVGVALPGRNKLFPSLGIGFNGIVLLGMVALLCLGVLAAAAGL